MPVTSMPGVNGLVLAGGQSRRMGRDKALLTTGNETQLSRAVHLLEDLVGTVYVSARADQAGDPERGRFRCISDRYDNLGPIAGILSAMDHDPTVAWLVMACDLPNVDLKTLTTLLAERSPSHPFTAYASSHDGMPEPLCAVYEPAARRIIDAFVADGIVCPRRIQIRSNTRLLEQPVAGALDNINTPDDLARNRRRAAS